ncbi:MAG: hypothetical protein PHV00_05970 [Syntrophales bacterium]|jgi:hypothetical protein|nr:hypothetical protein [Syntrophales bacterium]
MAQILFVKTPGGGQRSVQIVRSWLDASGRSVYLHTSGRYAHKDGSPLKSRDELGIIGDRVQREMALSWWSRVGEAESKKFYADLETLQAAAAGDFQEAPADLGELDRVMYTRRAAKKPTAATSAPKTWREWFAQRPDWWGQAKRVDFADYTYQLAETMAPEDARTPSGEPSAAAQTAETAAPAAGF